MMSFRLPEVGLRCVVVLACLVALGNAANATSDSIVGTVTMCDGSAKLRRGDQVYAVVRGAAVQLGDRIETTDSAKIALALEQGPAIMMGSSATIRIDRAGEQWQIAAMQGQTRLVHDGETKLLVVTGQVEMWVDRAIVQLESRSGQTRLELVCGSTIYQSSRKSARRLTNPATVLIGADGQIRHAARADWELHGEQIRLAAALQTSPVLQPPVTAPPAAVPDPTSDGVVGNLPAFEGATQPLDEDDDDDLLRFAQEPQPAATRGGFADGSPADTSLTATTNTFGGNSSLSLGSFFSASGIASSGGFNGDANQQTFQGKIVNGGDRFSDGDPFPGAIHLVTAQRRFPFENVQLSSSEMNEIFSGTTSKYYSIGTGNLPVGQVLTSFFTGTGVVPNLIDVPRFDAYLIELDQYNIPDPATIRNPADNPTTVGLTGLTGSNPTSPVVIGATPLTEDRSPNQLNPNATFALGEFLVKSEGTNGISFSIRRSDQDRLIMKDPGGNDANDSVTPNADVEFMDATDPRFLPQSPTVKVPVVDGMATTGTTYGELGFGRRAALTTLIADQLQDYSRRTRQTRFVVDGKIVDISGFRPSP